MGDNGGYRATGNNSASACLDDPAQGTTSGIIGAFEYVLDNGIRLSNNSWGSEYYSQALHDAIEATQAVGHLFVASAGNDHGNTDEHAHYPASYDLPNIISVAATDNDDDLAEFSNFGPTSVDLGAPGVKIYSTTFVNGYRYLNGTSMAAPHVTGVVGLVMSRRPAWTWSEVKARVLAGVRPVDSLVGLTVTGGVVNALNLGDCNGNGVADEVDIAGGTSQDCSGNGIPDECEPDCNGNGTADSCDVLAGTSNDCNGNVIPDECEPDCNGNGVPDSCDVIGGTSDDCQGNLVPDECELGENDCNGNQVPDECDIAAGTSRDCTENDVPDECELLPDCNANGLADYNDVCVGLNEDCNGNEVPDECDLSEGTSDDVNTNSIPDECDPDCNGNGIPDDVDIADGTSGDVNGNEVPDECDLVVFVDADAPPGGDGTSWATAYTDLQDALAEADLTEVWVAAGTYTPTEPDGDRFVTFQLRTGVRVFGGFAGGESRLDERDPATNVTILSGDLNGNDGPDFSNNSDNSQHVVSGQGVNSTAVLDGFTIRAGKADEYDGGPSHYSTISGGGVWLYEGSPTIVNCVLAQNLAHNGGGLVAMDSKANVIECLFIGNRGGGTGGGGGLSVNPPADVKVSGCTFVDNHCGIGGAVSAKRLPGNPMVKLLVINSVFSGNAANFGGAMRISGNTFVTLVNCTFSKNSAGRYGGGISNLDDMHPNGGRPTISNCVMWNNQDATGYTMEAQVCGGVPEVDYSCVQGCSPECFGGLGNIGDDPLFVDADGADNTVGTEDDDVRLSPGSPGIDAGDNAAVPIGVETDLGKNPRFVDILDVVDTGNGIRPIVDMGAFEHSTDCNGNGIADSLDIAGGTSWDCNENGVPDECEPDEDGDGLADECDPCPHHPENDADHDGVCFPEDQCPNDPNKLAPGLCGCGVAETGDSDGDGVIDCLDLCPGVDDAVFGPECQDAIPTVSSWGLVVLTLLFLTIGKILFARRRKLA